MQLNLNNIRAIKRLRAGIGRDIVGEQLSISVRNLERIESLYASVSDAMLVNIERLLHEREQLRSLISNLTRRNDPAIATPAQAPSSVAATNAVSSYQIGDLDRLGLPEQLSRQRRVRPTLAETENRNEGQRLAEPALG